MALSDSPTIPNIGLDLFAQPPNALAESAPATTQLSQAPDWRRYRKFLVSGYARTYQALVWAIGHNLTRRRLPHVTMLGDTAIDSKPNPCLLGFSIGVCLGLAILVSVGALPRVEREYEIEERL